MIHGRAVDANKSKLKVLMGKSSIPLISSPFLGSSRSTLCDLDPYVGVQSKIVVQER